jgi:Mor family transcriptional regulator
VASRELTDHLFSVLYGLNVRMGLSNADAQRSAREAVHQITQHYGGQRIYVPISEEARIARDAQIGRLHDGGLSVRELARRFQLSKSQIHRILGVPRFARKGDTSASESAHP